MKPEYTEGLEAQENFEEDMKALFRRSVVLMDSCPSGLDHFGRRFVRV